MGANGKISMESTISSDDLEDFPGRLLHQAALWDNAELLEDLLHSDQSRHINGVDAWGRTPLHAAATTENSQCLRILLQSGADPDVCSGPRGELRTPLHICGEYGHAENIQLLLSHGARVHFKDAIGLTALDLAVRGGHEKCVQALLTAQAVQEASRLAIHHKLSEACLRGDSESITKLLAREEKIDPKLVVNLSVEGSNTLLYKAAQLGYRDVVQVLIQYGAEPQVNPLTKYSPLYIACFEGHKDIVELLLKNFPELVQHQTVEKWLPSHACCLQGHHQILDLLLKFNYPASILKKYIDKSGLFEFEMPFNLNAKDVSGQTILYIASYMQHAKVVDLILRYRVKTKLINKQNGAESSLHRDVVPSKKRISNSIHALMMRLNVSLKSEATLDAPDYLQQSISPVDVDIYCDHGTQTALHVAVKAKNMQIASLLLSAGANPNLNIYLTDEEVTKISACSFASQEHYVFTGSSALVEAVRQKDTGMIDLLLKHGARDADSKALFVAVVEKDDAIIAKLLALKAHIDRESSVNRKGGIMIEGRTSFTPLAQLLPTNPVILNWHGLQCLEYIRTDWLTDAVESLNPKSRLQHLARNMSLHAITRIDVSNSIIVELPACIFQLQSLRYLNCAQNKLEHLPSGPYYAPVLEEVLLQDNRLDFLPEAIFKLPSLCILDVSNNKLQGLPQELWTSPKLKEFNASFNLLHELPCYLANQSQPSTPRSSVTSSISDGNTSLPYEVDSAYSIRSIQLENLNISRQQLVRTSFWRSQVHVNDNLFAEEVIEQQSSSQLTQLNLAHNNFLEIPPSLACLAFGLARLNLSFNNLKEIGPLCNFPHNLRQLDLSHNKIEEWRIGSSPPGLEDSGTSIGSQTISVPCYAIKERSPIKPQIGQGHKIHRITQCSGCLHRRHRRLENLRTINLADNLLSNIEIGCEEAGDDETKSKSTLKSKLAFPNLNSLDVSNNRIKTIPSAISELTHLSVLNISGNPDIAELPSEMGLLSKLWNLNMRGCNLQEPLRSMIESKKYKTMDVVGYLKSILQDARPYARMKLMLVGTQGIGKTSLLEQLRLEGTGSYKKKPPEHWAKRMGNKNVQARSPRALNLSTVGVDIGDWTYEKKAKGKKNFGPITFRTWDFAGQKEYYTTHQYFLSKRSLYLVLWRITDGIKAIDEIFHWLVNIQARAPNSPVIIVGTHYDIVKERFTPNYSEELQQVIKDRFIHVVDAEKCGLPRVLDSVEISCRTKHNIRNLCNVIYDSVFNLKLPGGKERLLEQRIPATYLALEDVVSVLSAELKSKGQDPVMSSDDFYTSVTSLMQTRFRLSFRDAAELSQATAFLHENGVILHYEDATLKDLYFLDPQWLCDMLAHVVTIREINPFAPQGIMKMEDLQLIFRASGSASLESQAYVLNLLNKFEVAVTWDSRTLLIPSLLPTEEQTCQGLPNGDARVKIPVRSRGRVVRSKKGPRMNRALSMPSRPAAVASPRVACLDSDLEKDKLDIRCQLDLETAIFRLVLLSYIPVGFWSRIITRLLAEDAIVDILRSYFSLPVAVDADLSHFLEWKAEWRCWQTGIELQYLGATILRIKEVTHSAGVSLFNQRDLGFVMKLDGQWCNLDIASNAMLEILLPNETVAIRKSLTDRTGEYALGNLPVQGYQTYALEPSVESVTKLLTIAVDHIDTLLEDWYPSLGTRFVHTSEGKYLVTRLVPCCLCLNASQIRPANEAEKTSDQQNQITVPVSSKKLAQSAERIPARIYAFSVEECIVQTHANRHVNCPCHGEIHLAQLAPDTLFLDIGERNIIHGQNLKLSSLLGRGAFGFVYKASVNRKGLPNAEVAVKMLQPVDPGQDARKSAQQLYEVVAGQWRKDPLQYACKAYCTARQELSILLTLRHPNIVPLVGLCTEPRALILELAPLGALDVHLKDYRRSGAKLSLNSIQQIVSQVSKAIEYLHQQRIIYRDLKSENVLVWSLPRPGQRPEHWRVDVKLADYGISRFALPTGNKGFGGTEGFMAPEIVRFNGEEEYNEKVDCFSFGMFLYELVTCRQPFEGHESVKEYLLHGGRPAITPHEAMFPVYLLDLMALCWSQHPKDRPTASQIVSIATAPEFVHLLDVISLNHDGFVTDGLAVPISSEDVLHELWLCSTACQIDLLFSSFDSSQSYKERGSFVDYHTLQTDIAQPITAACLVGDAVWLGDARGQIFCYSNKTYRCLFRYALEPDAPNNAAIRRFINLPSLHRVAVALANGRLFLCRSDFIPLTSTQGEGTFVMTELGLGGAGTPLHCLAAIFFSPKESVELWCGQSQGNICIFTLTDGAVKNQEIVNHYDPALPGLEVLQMVASDYILAENYCNDDTSYQTNNSEVASIQGPTVWSYVYPGCVVYQWNVTTRQILHRLDCSKLAPCSESLQSISIEEHLSPGKCQVTSLALLGQELYIGTNWGCVIVVIASSLRPITVFRPYEDEVRLIIPITLLSSDKRSSLLATVGKGYRNLLHRYGCYPNAQDDDRSVYCSGERKTRMNVLLWRTEHWY